jgi:hypothetical protein
MRPTCLIVLVCACTTGTSAPPPAASARCAALEGTTFASLTEGECGLGPSGPTACTWHITFTANGDISTSYSWQHSDVEESGEIQCDGSDITDVTTGSDRPRGTYDASTMHLVWDGVTYQP